MKTIKTLALSAAAVFFSISSIASEKPNVLIIGDSISIGYTPFVQENLKEEANVSRIPANSQDTNFGKQNIKAWLAPKKWDVITFNFGLWDMCYRNPGPVTTENRDKVNGKQAVPIEQYAENLEQLVAEMKKTEAKLIFVTTTVVPDREPGRFQQDVKLYNETAKAVMAKNGIEVVDLETASRKVPKQFHEGPTDVHYSPEGYKALAEVVTEGVKEAL